MPVCNAPKDSGPVPVIGAVHGADGVHDGCIKGFVRGYGGSFPYLGPYDRTKASTVLLGGIVVAKKFTFDPVNRYDPPGLGESEMRDILDRRFTVERLEQTEFTVRGQVHDALILLGTTRMLSRQGSSEDGVT